MTLNTLGWPFGTAQQSCDALLSAFDRVANGNSHLLCGPMREGALQGRFLRFVRGRTFKRALCESDLRRGWGNFHRYDAGGRQLRRGGGFYTGEHVQFGDKLSTAQFSSRLQDLLNSGPCWYGTRLPVAEVAHIVTDFVNHFPIDADQVQSVPPDFLFSHDYLGRNGGRPSNPRAICYFDGCGADHCYCWLSHGQLLVLLLNGTS